MRLALLFACALALSLSASALAAPPTVTVPIAKEDLLQIQTRLFKVGDRFRYLSQTRTVEQGGDFPGEQTNRAVFDLEVIAVDPKTNQPTLRFTLRDIAIVDARQPGIQGMMRAFIGVPVDFQTGPGIHPARTLNGAEARRLALENLTRTAENPAADRQTLDTLFGQLEATPEGLAGWLAADVGALAGMAQPFIPKGASETPTQTVTLGDGSTMTNDGKMKVDLIDPKTCRVTYTRETTIKVPAKSFDQLLKTQAVMASDGLPITLSQTDLKTAPGGYRFEETQTLTRQSIAPGCL